MSFSQLRQKLPDHSLSMSYLAPASSSSQSTATTSPQITSILILDNNSLLNISFLYRPFPVGEDEDDEAHFVGGSRGWGGEHWWFKLTCVCRGWRCLNTWVSILSGPLLCLYNGHARCRHAGMLTPLSTRHSFFFNATSLQKMKRVYSLCWNSVVVSAASVWRYPS